MPKWLRRAIDKLTRPRFPYACPKCGSWDITPPPYEQTCKDCGHTWEFNWHLYLNA